MLLQQSVVDNVRIYPVPFNIALVLPFANNEIDNEYPQRALNYIYSSSVGKKLSAMDILDSADGGTALGNRTKLHNTEYIRISGISFKHRVKLTENRIKLDMSKMSDFSSINNLNMISTETLLNIACTIYKGILQEERFKARYEEGVGAHVIYPIDMNVDKLSNLTTNGIWQFDPQGVRIKNHDLFSWVSAQYKELGKNSMGRKKLISNLIHIVSIYTIYYLLKDFCFQDILIESKDIVESMEHFLNTVSSSIEGEYETLARANKAREVSGQQAVTFEELQERDEGTTTYISLIVPDILRLLERLYYGEWIRHDDGGLLCDYTVQQSDVLTAAGLIGVRNQYSAIPSAVDVNIVCFGDTVVDNNDVLILLTNVEKIVNQLHYILAGVDLNALSANSPMREIEGLLCTVVRGMDEYEKISSIVMDNPQVNFINMIDLTIQGTDESNVVRQYVLKAVKQMFYEQLRSIVGSEPRPERGEVNSAVLTEYGFSSESVQSYLNASLEAIIFYTTKLNNTIVNSQRGAVAEHDLMKRPKKAEGELVYQYDIIGHKEKNVMNHIVRLRTLPTFGSVAQGNVCTMDINVQLLLGLRDFILAYRYFKGVKELYTHYMPQDTAVPEITIEWLLEMADHPYAVISNYAFVEPYIPTIPNPKEEQERKHYTIYKAISLLKTVEMLYNITKFKNLFPKFLSEHVVDFKHTRSRRVSTGLKIIFENEKVQELFFALADNVVVASNYYGSLPYATENRRLLHSDIEGEGRGLQNGQGVSEELLCALGKPNPTATKLSYCGVSKVEERVRPDTLRGLYSTLANIGIRHKQYLVFTPEVQDVKLSNHGCSAKKILSGTVEGNCKRKQYVLADSYNPKRPTVASEFSIMKGYASEHVKLYTHPRRQGEDGSDYSSFNSHWAQNLRSKINSYYPKYTIDNISVSLCRDTKVIFYPTDDFDFNYIYVPAVVDTQQPILPEKSVSKLYTRLIDIAHRFYVNRQISDDMSVPPTSIPHAKEKPGNAIMYEVLANIVHDVKIYAGQNSKYTAIDDAKQVQDVLNNMDLLSLLELVNQGIEYHNMNTILSVYDLMMILQDSSLQAYTDPSTNQTHCYVYQGNQARVIPEIYKMYDFNRREVRLPYVQEVGFRPEIESVVSNLTMQLRIPLAIYDKLVQSPVFVADEYKSKVSAEDIKSDAMFTRYADTPVELLYDGVEASRFGGEKR